jgi:hypothetical protein
MRQCIVYALIDGGIQIIECGLDENSEAADAMISGLPAAVGYLWHTGGASIDMHWVSEGVVEEKTEFEISVQGPVISNVPAHTSVIWPDGEMTIEMDGTVELESNVTGVFTLTLQNAQHVTVEVEVQNG